MTDSKPPKPPVKPATLAIVPAPGTRLSRQQVSDICGCSIRSVQRMDGNELHPEEENGRVWYNPIEVARVAAAMRATEGATAEVIDGAPTAEGCLASRVLHAFAQGKTPTQVVIEQALEPGVVKQLYLAWIDLEGAMLIPAAERRALRALLPAVRTPAELNAGIRWLVGKYRDLQGFSFPCCVCGEPVQASATGVWAAIWRGEPFNNWGHAECIRKRQT